MDKGKFYKKHNLISINDRKKKFIHEKSYKNTIYQESYYFYGGL